MIFDIQKTLIYDLVPKLRVSILAVLNLLLMRLPTMSTLITAKLDAFDFLEGIEMLFIFQKKRLAVFKQLEMHSHQEHGSTDR